MQNETDPRLPTRRDLLVGGAAACAGREEHLERDRATGDLVGGEEHAPRCAGTEELLEPIAAGDHFLVARGLALRALITPVAQVHVEIGGHVRVARAELEQGIARAVAQAHRGERGDQVPLRFGTELGPLARFL